MGLGGGGGDGGERRVVLASPPARFYLGVPTGYSTCRGRHVITSFIGAAWHRSPTTALLIGGHVLDRCRAPLLNRRWFGLYINADSSQAIAPLSVCSYCCLLLDGNVIITLHWAYYARFPMAKLINHAKACCLGFLLSTLALNCSLPTDPSAKHAAN